MESTIKGIICDHEGVIENAGTSGCNIQDSFLTLVQRFISLLYITIKLLTTDTMMSMSASFKNLTFINTQLARPASHTAVMAIVQLLPFIIEIILNESIPSTQRRWDNTKMYICYVSMFPHLLLYTYIYLLTYHTKPYYILYHTLSRHLYYLKRDWGMSSSDFRGMFQRACTWMEEIIKKQVHTMLLSLEPEIEKK